MATAQRVFYETVTVIVFLLLLVAAWMLSGYRAERRLGAAREEQSRVLERRAEEHREALRRLEEARDAAAGEQRRAEAAAVFRGFAAGLQPATLEGWRRFLSASREQLMGSDPKVAFVHLLTPAGYVLTSSDPDLLARGRLDESGDWVLAAEGLTNRDGDGGVLELAGPVLSNKRPVAYLWLGYDIGAAPVDPSR